MTRITASGFGLPGRGLAPGARVGTSGRLVPLASQHGQVPLSAVIPGRDAERPLSVDVEGDIDQRLARAGRSDLRHLEHAEPLVERGQRVLTLKGPELDGRLAQVSRGKVSVTEAGSGVPFGIS